MRLSIKEILKRYLRKQFSFVVEPMKETAENVLKSEELLLQGLSDELSAYKQELSELTVRLTDLEKRMCLHE